MPQIRLSDFILYLPTLLAGARLTILLSLGTFCVATVIGLLVALGRLSRFRILRILLTVYVEFIRGTPGLVQIYYIFYVLPFWGLTLNAALAGIRRQLEMARTEGDLPNASAGPASSRSHRVDLRMQLGFASQLHRIARQRRRNWSG